MGSPTFTSRGRIGTDITYRAVGNSGVARFRMITNDRKKIDHAVEVGQDQWEDANTTGWNVEIWGNSAIKVRDHLEKGDPIIVIGVIFEDKWTDKEGEEKSSMLVKAEAIGLDVGKVKN